MNLAYEYSELQKINSFYDNQKIEFEILNTDRLQFHYYVYYVLRSKNRSIAKLELTGAFVRLLNALGYKPCLLTPVIYMGHNITQCVYEKYPNDEYLRPNSQGAYVSVLNYLTIAPDDIGLVLLTKEVGKYNAVIEKQRQKKLKRFYKKRLP